MKAIWWPVGPTKPVKCKESKLTTCYCHQTKGFLLEKTAKTIFEAHFTGNNEAFPFLTFTIGIEWQKYKKSESHVIEATRSISVESVKPNSIPVKDFGQWTLMWLILGSVMVFEIYAAVEVGRTTNSKEPPKDLCHGHGPDFHFILKEYLLNNSSQGLDVIHIVDGIFLSMILITGWLYIAIFAENYQHDGRMKALLGMKAIQKRHIGSAITSKLPHVQVLCVFDRYHRGNSNPCSFYRFEIT